MVKFIVMLILIGGCSSTPSRPMQKNLVIKKLGLLPHPEGGYFSETYRSKGKISKLCLKNNSYDGDRNYSTAIYYLVEKNQLTRFHRLKSDEIFHFYQGNPLIIHVIDLKGEYQKYFLGNDFASNQSPQVILQAGTWFGTESVGSYEYSLVGTTVAPGFSMADLEMVDLSKLLETYPAFKKSWKIIK